MAATKPSPRLDECAATDCPRRPRMAVRTTRPTRGQVRVTIFTDDRTAPKTGPTRYCHQHGVPVVAELVAVLVDGDEPEQEGGR